MVACRVPFSGRISGLTDNAGDFRGKLASASLKYRSRETRPYIIEAAFNGDKMLVEVSFTPLPLHPPRRRVCGSKFSPVKKALQKSSFLGMVRHGVTHGFYMDLSGEGAHVILKLRDRRIADCRLSI